jgi:uncharacterized protein YggL (DUF469 family)
VSGACPELGFEVELEIARAGPDVWAELTRRLERELMERGGLASTGVVRGSRWHLAFQRDGGQTTELDRERVRAWADAQPEIVRASIGPLVDLADTA